MNEIRDIHEPFCRWLDKLEVPYHRNRPDKKTTAKKGDPDFLITFMSRCVYVEAKIPGNKLSPDQEKRIAHIRKSGNKVVIAHSLEDCIEAVKDILCDGKPEMLLEARTANPERMKERWEKLKETVRNVGVKPAKEPRPKKQPELPVNGNDAVMQAQGFAIANWNGTNYVMAKKQDGSYDMIRPASVFDVMNIPKLSA